MKTLRAALLCLPLLVACGGDANRTDEYAGTWLMTSITMPDQFGTVTVTRDGAPNSLRGDAVFVPTGDTAAGLHVRQMGLGDGVPVTGVMSQEIAVAIEGDTWVLTDEDGKVTVFTAMLHEGQHLMLTLADDPRITAEQPPLEVQLMRATPWGASTVGTWDLTSMTIPTIGTMPAGACMEIMPGNYAKLELTMVMDEHLVFQRSMTMTAYGDSACTQMISATHSAQTGLAEEEGAVLRLWGTDGEAGEHLTFALATAGSQLTLTRTSCLPTPACNSAPTTVIVHRR